jgi:hypothetical protein
VGPTDEEQNANVIFTATVVAVHKSAEEMVSATDRTAVVKISRMDLGADIAGDQAGRLATILLSPSAPKIAPGQALRIAGNIRFIGKSLTVDDVSEHPLSGDGSSPLATGGSKDRALLPLLAAASAIFVGRVEEVHALTDSKGEAQNTRAPESTSEHDPLWSVASVRVLDPIKGAEKGALVSIVFSASRDVMWFNSPKLAVSQEALLITHPPAASGARLEEDRGVREYLAKAPASVIDRPLESLSNKEVAHVRGLLNRQEAP